MRKDSRQLRADGVQDEPIFYEDGPNWRIVDLRPHGADCMPLFAFGNFGAVRPGAALHVHSGRMEACLCLKGKVIYETDALAYPVLPGHVFISRPDEPHRRRNNPKGLSLYRILIDLPPKGGRILGLTEAESSCIVTALKKIPFRVFHATDRLRSAFVRLFSVFDAHSEDAVVHRLEMRNAALELLLALIESPYAPHSAKCRPTAKVKEIAKRISEHPEQEYPVAALAAEASLSSFSFSEAFKRMTGLTPHAYLVDQRVRHAYADLKACRGSIKSVSIKWRFSSPQHMAVAFKRIIGVTPSLVVLESQKERRRRAI